MCQQKLLPMILWQLLLHQQMLLLTFIVSYWFMTDVIVKDYGYSLIAQLADVIAFIVCGRCEPHVDTYCLFSGR